MLGKLYLHNFFSLGYNVHATSAIKNVIIFNGLNSNIFFVGIPIIANRYGIGKLDIVAIDFIIFFIGFGSKHNWRES